MKQYIVRKEVSIKATPSAVWDALTNPAKTKKYFFNCEVHSDWKVGSRITFKGKIFLIKKIELNGTITGIEPEKFLQYELKNESDKKNLVSHSMVTEQLIYENGETILSVTDDVGAGEGASERFEKSQKGWDKVLKGLKKLVEEEANDRTRPMTHKL